MLLIAFSKCSVKDADDGVLLEPLSAPNTGRDGKRPALLA